MIDIYIIIIRIWRALKSYLRKALLEITILAKNNRNLIANLRLWYKIINLFNRLLIIFLARASLSKESLIYINTLSSSISKKSTIIFIIFLS